MDRLEVNKTKQISHQQTGTKTRRVLTHRTKSSWNEDPGRGQSPVSKQPSTTNWPQSHPNWHEAQKAYGVSPQTRWQREPPTAEKREFQCTSLVWQTPQFTDTRFPNPVSRFYSSPIKAVRGSQPNAGRGRAGRVPETKEILAVSGTSL